MKYELSRYRLDIAKKRMDTAELLFSAERYEDAIFSAARALLATKELDSAKHSGVMSLFNLHFVKPGIVSKEMSKILKDAKAERERSDYEDFVIVSKEEAEAQIQSAKEFIHEVEVALSKLKND